MTLKPGAVYKNVFPVDTLLVVGTTRFGFWGVLLAVCAPVSTCAVPVDDTAKGNSNCMLAAVPTVFDIFHDASHQFCERSSCREGCAP